MSNKHLFQAYLKFSNQQLVLKLHTGGFGPFSIIGTHYLIEILTKTRDNGVFISTPKIRNLSNLSQNCFVSFSTCSYNVYKISKLNINPNKSYDLFTRIAHVTQLLKPVRRLLWSTDI